MERPTTAYDLATLRAVRAETQRRYDTWQSAWKHATTEDAKVVYFARFQELESLLVWMDWQISEAAAEDHLDDRYVLTACGQASMST